MDCGVVAILTTLRSAYLSWTYIYTQEPRAESEVRLLEREDSTSVCSYPLRSLRLRLKRRESSDAERPTSTGCSPRGGVFELTLRAVCHVRSEFGLQSSKAIVVG